MRLTSRFVPTILVSLGLLATSLPSLSAPEQLGSGASRKVHLEGTRNARQLGGISLGKGFVFRKDQVFRSGALCFITRNDSDKLHKIGIKTVIDLRVDREIAREGPDKSYFLSGIPNVVRLPMTNSQGLGQEAYHYLIRENRPAISSYFKILSEPKNYPVLFHCSAGKDRTGILSALLLEMLGANREVIMDDYLESLKNSAALKVHKEWLEEVYDFVDESGGIERFLISQGVTTAQMSEIRQLLRQSVSTP
jgi:protein-tyrosine phosphatase